MIDDSHIDYLIAYGVSQDEFDFQDLIAEGAFGYALPLDDTRHDVLRYAPQNALPRVSGRLTCKGYKPICAFGYLGMMICAICVKLSPVDMRREFCPIGEMW